MSAGEQMAPRRAPRFSYSIGASYTLESGVGSFTLAANDSCKSRSYFDPNNRLSQDPYHLVGASITWRHPDRKLDLQLFVRNLAKERYFVLGTEALNDVYSPGAPRTYGITLGYHY